MNDAHPTIPGTYPVRDPGGYRRHLKPGATIPVGWRDESDQPIAVECTVVHVDAGAVDPDPVPGTGEILAVPTGRPLRAVLREIRAARGAVRALLS